MEPFNVFPVMLKSAKIGLERQKAGPKDYYDENGMLICGVCGEPKQDMYPFPNPSPTEPDRKTPIKRVRQCFCDRQREAEEENRRRAEKDMEAVLKLKRMSLMDSRFSDATFANYQKTDQNAKNLRLCRRYVEVFDLMVEKNQGLLMYGKPGTGKSYSAACIANALLAKKIPVVMTSFVRMLDVIMAGEEQVDDLMRRMRRAKLVIFDDLGAERGTQYAIEQVYNIVDTRYRQRLPMIVTTNLTKQQMIDESNVQYSRIYDRIFETCYLVPFVGDSFRRKEANRRYRQMEDLLKGGDDDW